LARTYYPGTPQIDEARAVTLAAGQDLDGLDFALASVPAATVAGAVVDSAGTSQAIMSVRLRGVGAPPGQEMLRVASQQKGGFQFPSVPPGEYWLTAATLSGPGAAPEFSAQRLTISGQDVADLRVTTAKGVTVSGRVDADDSALSVPSRMQVTAFPTEFELPTPQSATPIGAAVTVNADGTFALGSVFGPCAFQLGPLKNGWALLGVWMGGQEITDTVVDVKSGMPVAALRFVITSKTATASGTVENDLGQPAPAARVVIFSHDARTWGARSRFIKSAEVTSDGRFSIDGLLPGEYDAAAVVALEEGAWFDPEVLGRLAPRASTVAVTVGQKLTLALKVR
jgi:hypothetical protein